MNVLNSLTARIFAIFWLTLALVLMLVLMLPKFDERKLTDISDGDRIKIAQVQKEIETLYVSRAQAKEDSSFRRNLFVIQEKLAASTGLRLVLITNEGRILGTPPHEMRTIRNFIVLSDNIDEPKKKRYERLEVLGPFAINSDKETFQFYAVRMQPSPQSAFISQLLDRPLFLLAITMLISTPLLLWLAWSLAKPARRLKVAADSVGQGNLREHPELESGPIEFRAVGISFNRMVNGLESMVSAQQRLISDISHELRTPLTRLQLATALMRRKQGEGVELTRIETEASRLENMINSLLILSRSRNKNELDKEILIVNELWEDVLENAQFEAEQIGKTFDIIAPPKEWKIFGSRDALDSSLENIVRNAIKYSNQRITITFNGDHKGISILVDDDGPGVSEEEREQIFRPFYRTDEARDRSSGGNGLGLAIVEAAITQHNGTVKAEASPLGGLRIILWLPLTAR
jgi:two-component system sensor histidine kinase CpxA